MRPTGEVRQALLQAAVALTTAERAPTLRELAAHAQVGQGAARYTVQHMHRSGALEIVRTRRVSYRNRPVAEYAPAARQEAANGGRFQLDAVMRGWAALA